MARLDTSKVLTRILIGIGAGLGWITGCTGISIQPSCPEELVVGEKGFVFANEERPGAIATFQWEVIPDGTATFEDATQADTTFTGDKVANVMFRLTASDGLFQVQSECTTRIVATTTVPVTLEADQLAVEVGGEVTLTCASGSADQSVAYTLEQVAGPSVELADSGVGMATFSPSQAGTLTFQCTAEDASGPLADPVSVSVTVSEPAGSSDSAGAGDTSASTEPPASNGDTQPVQTGDSSSGTATGGTGSDASNAGQSGTDSGSGSSTESPSRSGGRGGRTTG